MILIFPTHHPSPPVYPSASNPVQAPLVTQIGNETRFMIDITHSVPSNLSINLGYSTLLVRVQDKSSMKDNDFTYYTLVRMIILTYSDWAYYVIMDSHNIKHTNSYYIGGEMGGAEGARTPPLWKMGGLSPLIFQMCILFSMPYTIQRSLKTTVRRPQKHSPRVEKSKFSWGSMPPDPPRWLFTIVLDAWAPSLLQSILRPWLLLMSFTVSI